MFVDGKEASNVSVMEGDSVTLKSGVTDVKTVDDIEWRFNGKRIDKFVDRLQRVIQTGDLKISNIRTKDSGLYKVKISSPTGSSEMEFNVTGMSFLYNTFTFSHLAIFFNTDFNHLLNLNFVHSIKIKYLS